MTVVSSVTDREALTLTFVAEFDASVERVWQVWENPRQLERWWGPPTWPATFERHDFVVGGSSSYYMTGPDGEKERGWWVTTGIRSPYQLEFEDGFADANGEPVVAMGIVRAVVTFEESGGRTLMTTVSRFENKEQLEKMMEMGMNEGMRLAMGQIDSLVAEVHA